MNEVTVIVPIYNAVNELQHCLQSLLETLSPKQPLLLLDDGSPDPAIRPLLLDFQKRRPGTQINLRDENWGFVRTVNQAMQMVKDDVVLLNSDTITTTRWLERLRQCVASDQSIATATPWSNNAEICSYPNFCVNSTPPDDPNAYAATIARAGFPMYPDIPTAVGFCMYITRRALDEIGHFDAETFGQGYGEENDFCMRIRAAGLRNVLCDDAYVVHVGGRSFSDKGLKPGGENLKRLLQLHPDYQQLIDRFIAADPLKPLRHRIDEAMRDASMAVS